MQNLINSWGSLLEVTGGALSVEKTWWYLIEYGWKRRKWVSNDAYTEVDLIATSSKGNRVSLKSLQAHKVFKVLGVWTAPNGDKNTI